MYVSLSRDVGKGTRYSAARARRCRLIMAEERARERESVMGFAGLPPPNGLQPQVAELSSTADISREHTAVYRLRLLLSRLCLVRLDIHWIP